MEKDVSFEGKEAPTSQQGDVPDKDRRFLGDHPDLTGVCPLTPLVVWRGCVADYALSRAERAHARLTWALRLACNARPETAGRVTIRLFGVPEHFATSLGLATDLTMA